MQLRLQARHNAYCCVRQPSHNRYQSLKTTLKVPWMHHGSEVHLDAGCWTEMLQSAVACADPAEPSCSCRPASVVQYLKHTNGCQCRHTVMAGLAINFFACTLLAGFPVC